MGMPGMKEMLVIFGIFVLLFGAKKIPELAKGIGQSIKEMRRAAKDVEEINEDDEEGLS